MCSRGQIPLGCLNRQEQEHVACMAYVAFLPVLQLSPVRIIPSMLCPLNHLPPTLYNLSKWLRRYQTTHIRGGGGGPKKCTCNPLHTVTWSTRNFTTITHPWKLVVLLMATEFPACSLRYPKIPYIISYSQVSQNILLVASWYQSKQLRSLFVSCTP
jgi:hypothetical protein